MHPHFPVPSPCLADKLQTTASSSRHSCTVKERLPSQCSPSMSLGKTVSITLTETGRESGGFLSNSELRLDRKVWEMDLGDLSSPAQPQTQRDWYWRGHRKGARKRLVSKHYYTIPTVEIADTSNKSRLKLNNSQLW